MSLPYPFIPFNLSFSLKRTDGAAALQRLKVTQVLLRYSL